MHAEIYKKYKWHQKKVFFFVDFVVGICVWACVRLKHSITDITNIKTGSKQYPRKTKVNTFFSSQLNTL